MKRARKNHQRGSTILPVMLMFVPICGAIGLVTDIGWFYFTREAAQTAAEAAAIAGVKAAMDGVTAGGTYACGSRTLACQAESGCPATITLPVSSTAQNACLYAKANGFTNNGMSGRQTVSISANVTSPAPTAPGVQVQYWVSAHITQKNPLGFLGVLGGRSLTVGVRSTAGVIAAITPTCLTVLDPSGSAALNANNGVSVTLKGCNAQVNSSSATAVQVVGGSVFKASAVRIVGGYTTNNGGSITAPTTGIAAVSDPLASVAVPSFTAGHCDYTNTTVIFTTSRTLSPGNYCGGISLSNGATAHFNSGTYVLMGGGFTSAGGATITGSGVTFYNTCTSGACGGGNTGFAPFSISNGSNIALSAPASGPLSGILFFEDRTVSSSSDQIMGGSTANFAGALYLSRSALTYSNGSSSNIGSTVIVARDVTFTGGSTFIQSSTTGSSTPSTPTAAILQ